MGAVRYPVTFIPAGVTVWAKEGATVLDVARSAGILISAPCGGRGVCGKCAVRVLEGSPEPPEDLEKRGLSIAPPGVRLACLLRVTGPISVKPVISQGVSVVPNAEESSDERVLAAVDLGTTTVEAVIFGEQTGMELGRAAVPNAQQSYGADLLSRVAAAGQGHAEALRVAADASMRSALEAACTRAGACLVGIRRLVVVGNSVMSASILGEPLESFAAHPFASPISEVLPLPEGSKLVLALADDCETYVLPPLVSFVGSDAVSGLLGAGLVEPGHTALYVDVGTNAELAVVTSAGLTVASAAAGPALEASEITAGGPAAPGGVRLVRYDEESGLKVDVIGAEEAAWLTGSGLVSAAAALLAAGHLEADGLMKQDGPLADRFGRVGGTLAVRIAGDEASPVWISQTDIRALQTAKSALAAGILTLLKSAKVKPKAIETVMVGGALGAAIPASDLVALGIVPKDYEDRVEQVGNAALLGAAMMTADPTLISDTIESTKNASHVELATEKDFSERFMEALALAPYSVKKGFPKS